MKENIRAIFVYLAVNFQISNRITGRRSNIRNFEYKLNIRPILTWYTGKEEKSNR